MKTLSTTTITPLQAILEEFFNASHLSSNIQCLNNLLYHWVHSEDFKKMDEMHRQNEMFQLLEIINLLPKLQEAYLGERMQENGLLLLR